jgi:N-acylneuraminate cytidylyltransferase
MKVIIPAKTSSSRTEDKNWREFHDGKSMVEIKIEQLIAAGILPDDINISCEDESKRKIVESYSARFLSRGPETVSNAFHWSDVVSSLVSSVECPESESVAWVYACTPLFDAKAFQNVFAVWETLKEGIKYDSLITVKKFKEFVLDDRCRPVNFNFGRWHEWSQDLPQWYILESPIHIMSKATYLRCNYYIGERPYMYEVPMPSIDIDTPEEFELAQKIFSAIHI